jgi:hypothetical protein
MENAMLTSDARFAGRRWLRRSLISTVVAVPALLALTACGGAAPAPPSKPTVQAAATQVVAGASPAAATMQAAASPAAATLQAAASPAAGTAAALTGTVVAGASPMASPSPAAQASLRIADASLADATPWVSIMNDSEEPVEVGGWQLQVGSASAALPDSAIVPPGGTLTLHAGDGMSSDDELFLGTAGDALASAALPGTPVRLSDGAGQLIHEVTVPRF